MTWKNFDLGTIASWAQKAGHSLTEAWGGRDDVARVDVSGDAATARDLGRGDDLVLVKGTDGQVRLTFTSAEVGNGSAVDANAMANQDGGLAVRLQAEDGADGLTGPISRFDDEGISFKAASPGLTFDVRDLVAGTQRGDQFDVVRLGTAGDDRFNESGSRDAYYVNAGMGDDSITGGRGDDFLVGGAGDDRLKGGRGDDSLLGGAGDDVAVFNPSRDGTDTVDLGAGDDVVLVKHGHLDQVRLTFTSAEVGNGSANDAGTLANQDGGLAVRLQAEDGMDGLAGPVSRFDDEGITFTAQHGGSFDVRDLVAGTQRGDQFEVVRLGTSAGDTIDLGGQHRPAYVNAGMGDDAVTGGAGRDFLVGGAGNDSLGGGEGQDSLLGGGGADTFVFGSHDAVPDDILDFVAGEDTILLDSMAFAGLDAGALDAGAFALLSDAAEEDDRILYDADTGALFFDADGGGRDHLVNFAVLTTRPAGLAASDFVIG